MFKWLYDIWCGPQNTKPIHVEHPTEYALCQRCNGNRKKCDYDWSGACSEAERMTGNSMAGFLWNASRARSGRN